MYEINANGTVRRLARDRYKWRQPNVLKGSVGTTGYRFYRLSGDDGSETDRAGHRLVAEAFIGPIPGDKEVNHLNGNKIDNRLQNLEIVTRSENVLHAYRTGLMVAPGTCGEVHGMSKLAEDSVREIRRRYASGGASLRNLAAEFGVTKTAVHRIVRGEGWQHVG